MTHEIPYENALMIMKNKTSKGILVWVILSLVLLVVCFTFLLCYSFHPEEQIYGYIQKIDEYRLITYIRKEEISTFPQYQLFIEKEEIPFQVEQIGQATKIDDDIYYEVVLDINIKEEWKIENNVLSMIVRKPKTTWVQKIKKGMKL